MSHADLIERLKKAEAGSRVIDADMALAIDPKFAGWIKHPNLKDDSSAWMQGELWPSREEFDDWLIRDRIHDIDFERRGNIRNERTEFRHLFSFGGR